MSIKSYLMRLVSAAAFLFGHVTVADEIALTVEPFTHNLTISGLSKRERDSVMATPENVRLTVSDSDAVHSMPVTLQKTELDIVVIPRFKLLSGTRYSLSIAAVTGKRTLPFAAPSPQELKPKLIGFAPSQAVIPENTLRLYLYFSKPMARGQLRESLRLVNQNGDEITNPFLMLHTELWDTAQKRATVLFDPGRVKRHVGPNKEVGAPLDQGENYSLIVSGTMESAEGVSLGHDAKLAFRVGPAERRKIDPKSWEISLPEFGSYSPVAITFDRIMDSGGVKRFLKLQKSDGHTVRGQILSDGAGWSLKPEQRWQSGTYYVVISPELEDVAGNTTRAPFDQEIEMSGTTWRTIYLPIKIGR